MPVADIVASLFEVIGKIIARLFAELLLEIIVKGPGYIIIRRIKDYNYKAVDPEGWQVLFAGIMFWLLVGGIGYAVYRAFSNN